MRLTSLAILLSVCVTFSQAQTDDSTGLLGLLGGGGAKLKACQKKNEGAKCQSAKDCGSGLACVSPSGKRKSARCAAMTGQKCSTKKSLNHKLGIYTKFPPCMLSTCAGKLYGVCNATVTDPTLPPNSGDGPKNINGTLDTAEPEADDIARLDIFL